MRIRHKALLALLLTCLIASNGHAIIIRHDKGPASYKVASTDYPSIFYVEKQRDRKVCVATVIHRRWAITAAHCAHDTSLFSTLEKGEQFKVSVAGKTRYIDRLVIHSQYDISSSTDVDLVLLRFREGSSFPRPIALQIDEDEQGQVVNLLGWGFFGFGTTGRQYDDGQLRLAQNRIETANRRLRFNFDDPRIRGSEALPLEGMPGLGDSGGPALLNIDTVPILVGIAVGELETADFTEETQGKYGAIAIYERISQHIGWIERVVGSQIPFEY